MLQTLEQKRAKFAYEFVSKISRLRYVDGLDSVFEELLGMMGMDLEEKTSFCKKLVEALPGNDRQEKDSFCKELEIRLSSYIKKAPVMILTNGLRATMAFFLAKTNINRGKALETIRSFLKVEKENLPKKAKDVKNDLFNPTGVSYLLLYNSIRGWLVERGIGAVGEDESSFLKSLIDLDWTAVVFATKEALAMLRWMQRFAEAMLEKGETEDVT